MECIILPSNACRQPLQVPCLCDYKSYEESQATFQSYPEARGYEIAALANGESKDDQLNEFASFIQSWLFFGVLSELSRICCVKYKPEDFVKRGETLDVIAVTTERLEEYLWYWFAAEDQLPYVDRMNHIAQAGTCLETLNKVSNAICDVKTTSVSPVAQIHLSIAVLGDSLCTFLSYIFSLNSRLSVLSELQWELPALGRTMLVESGWCVGDVSMLNRECTPTVCLYLGYMDMGSNKSKDHRRCSSGQGCLANQIDEKIYKTRHAEGCDGCEMRGLDMKTVSAILTDGDIPLATYRPAYQGEHEVLSVGGAMLQKESHPSPYVAVSHVWSDGMGNPKSNELPKCQISRIQRLVNDLYGSSRDGLAEPVAFWMDTLCVPLEPSLRSVAITRMAKTFSFADRVIILDSSLCTINFDSPLDELLIRIRYSPWNSRLWTLQEGLLGHQCHVQFKNGTLLIDQLDLQHTMDSSYRNLNMISKFLTEKLSAGLLKDSYQIKLIRALAMPDTSASNRKHQSSLPPQEDPEEEERRQIAIESDIINARTDPLRQFWTPWLISSGQNMTFTEYDRALRVRIQKNMFNIVGNHGYKAISKFRGMIYEISENRPPGRHNMHDRRVNETLSAIPHTLFRDVAAALPGRSTSHPQDEAICVGALLGLNLDAILSAAPSSTQNNHSKSDAQVCTRRMQALLSSTQIFPSDMIFWTVPRLQSPGWRWAPSSFLHRSLEVANTMSTYGSFEQGKGLIVQHPGIRLFDPRLIEKTGNITTEPSLQRERVAQQPSRENSQGLNTSSVAIDNEIKVCSLKYRELWQHIRLLPLASRHDENPAAELSWGQYLALATKSNTSLAIIVDNFSRYEGILVMIEKDFEITRKPRFATHNEWILRIEKPVQVSYLAHVERVRKRKNWRSTTPKEGRMGSTKKTNFEQAEDVLPSPLAITRAAAYEGEVSQSRQGWEMAGEWIQHGKWCVG